MKERSRQCPLAGPRPYRNVVQPLLGLRRFRFVGRFTLLLLVVGVSLFGVVQSSAAALSDLMPKASARAEARAETAHWRTIPHDAPPPEVSALEPEANEEPAAPDATSVVRPVFGHTRIVPSSGQAVHAVGTIRVARFAASSVLARAPPSRGTR